MFKVMMLKITKKNIESYFRKHIYSTYDEVAAIFSVSKSLLRKKYGKEIISSLNHKSKYIIYAPPHKFNSYGLKSINDMIFSKNNDIKSTLLYIIGLKDISSSKLYDLIGFNVRQQISQLLKSKEIFSKNKGKHSFYSIHPFENEIIRIKEFDIRSLNPKDSILRNLEIIKQIKSGKKKTEIAKEFNITPETVKNIWDRFNKDGIKSLIRKRESKPYKITKPIEAAIITEAVKHPNKTDKQIIDSIRETKTVSVKSVKSVLKKMKEFIGSKKKILFEIRP